MAIPQTVTMSCGLMEAVMIGDAAPLYKRAPRQDEDGRPLGDFMMIIPHLRTLPPRLLQSKIERIQHVLTNFGNLVVFADLNLKINVLWVIVRQAPRVCIEIPQAITMAVPEALLVSHPRFC